MKNIITSFYWKLFFSGYWTAYDLGEKEDTATATGAALYYSIDTFYPGGFNGAMQNNANLVQQNQQVLGQSFNLYKDIRGGW